MSATCRSIPLGPNLLFGAGRRATTSHRFEVRSTPIRVSAFGLVGLGRLRVERVVYSNGEEVIVQAVEGSCLVTLLSKSPAVTLTNPGWYQVSMGTYAGDPEDITVMQEEIRVPTITNTGGSGMSCGLTIEEVNELIKNNPMVLAGAGVSEVIAVEDGWEIVMKNGDTIAVPMNDHNMSKALVASGSSLLRLQLATRHEFGVDPVTGSLFIVQPGDVRQTVDMASMVAPLPTSLPIGG